VSTGEIKICSIAGAAGPIHKLSKRLQAEFHEFLSCLFTMSELRGRDASGFWVWRNDHYIFEKRPTAAEDLIERSPRWKGLRYNPGSLYLIHTRAATDGDPNENSNNHPHIGEHSVMIHNGMIWGHNTIAIQHDLKMKTDCDSEVLLRLAESVEDIKDGLKLMYQVANDSNGTDSIATAFVDRRAPNKIYLSRNSGNPCHIYYSKRFGCTFFISTDIIFERALEMLYKTKNPKVIEAKGESIDVNYLYELSEDGSYKKEFLVDAVTSRYSNNEFLDFEEDETEIDHYISGYFAGQMMSIALCGTMTVIETEEVDSDAEFTESIKMPWDIEQNLREYIKLKVGEE